MTLSLIESAFTYRSESGGQSWYYTIVQNMNGVLGIRDILSPYGPLCDSNTQIPQFVLDDQQTAIGQVENILATTSAINGILTFTNDTSQTVTFATPLSNTSYRVQIAQQDPVYFWTTNKSLTGFTINASISFTGFVGFDLFV